jgi:hypothetical protein
MSRDEELAWEVFMQGLDMTSSELVDGARKECKNPLTTFALLNVILYVDNVILQENEKNVFYAFMQSSHFMQIVVAVLMILYPTPQHCKRSLH